MKQALCKQCGTLFVQDAPWKTICLSCYKLNKRKEKPVTSDPLYIQGYNAGVATGRALARKPVQNSGISASMLKRLISLCHPDKHGNSKMSTEVTQELLKMKG